MTCGSHACYTCAVAIALALASGVLYGVSDFVGGKASRRALPVVVALLAELTLVVATVLVVPFAESGGPTPPAVWWGIVGGLAGAIGVLGLYHALSGGSMTVVAPVTGVVAAAVPVFVGVALGERPSPIAVVGIGVAFASVMLIGGLIGVGHDRVGLSTIALAVGVGAAFGMLFVAFSRTGDDSGLWPLLTARIGATPMLVGALLVARRRSAVIVPDGRATVAGIAIGMLIGASNGLYLMATRRGLLSVVAVLVALYPASTVALAALIDGERATRWQLTGMVAAAIAVVLITIGS